MRCSGRFGAALAAGLALAAAAAAADENYERWPLLKNPFESTGGGGIMIDGYDPAIMGKSCVTDFTATDPTGKVYYNRVEFDAVPVSGGVLCTNGRWRSLDGTMSGTTPLRVFIKNGVRRRSP